MKKFLAFFLSLAFVCTMGFSLTGCKEADKKTTPTTKTPTTMPEKTTTPEKTK